MNNTFGFIGTGNMGGALARAAVKVMGPEAVFLANKTAAKAEALAAELGCSAGSNEAAAQCGYGKEGVFRNPPLIFPGFFLVHVHKQQTHCIDYQ